MYRVQQQEQSKNEPFQSADFIYVFIHNGTRIISYCTQRGEIYYSYS
jgi:hypothetical protein